MEHILKERKINRVRPKMNQIWNLQRFQSGYFNYLRVIQS